jgi:hypothetical protein
MDIEHKKIVLYNKKSYLVVADDFLEEYSNCKKIFKYINK